MEACNLAVPDNAEGCLHDLHAMSVLKASYEYGSSDNGSFHGYVNPTFIEFNTGSADPSQKYQNQEVGKVITDQFEAWFGKLEPRQQWVSTLYYR